MILIWKSEKLLRPQCGKLVIKCRNRMTNNSVKTMIVKWPATASKKTELKKKPGHYNVILAFFIQDV